MSLFIKRENLDQENSRMPSKEAENAVVPQKRPLLPKNTSEKRFRRVPLGGKDHNNLPLLQRSLTTVQKAKAHLPTAWQPALGRSNSSLGFSHQPGLVAKKETVKKDTNPLKNNLLPADNAARSSQLVPRFSTDSLQKPEPKTLPPSGLLSLPAPLLHASHLPVPEQVPEPTKVKRGVKPMEKMDAIIEALAEDENSVQTVPERTELVDVPAVSPLKGPNFRFLEPEVKSLAANFDSSAEMSLDDLLDDRESTRIEEREMAVELEKAGPLGLSEQELNDLLDY